MKILIAWIALGLATVALAERGAEEYSKDARRYIADTVMQWPEAHRNEEPAPKYALRDDAELMTAFMGTFPPKVSAADLPPLPLHGGLK